MTEPLISILILAHNKSAYTRRCLDSLLHSTLRPFEVVLVDNGSTDDTPALFDAWQKKAEADRIVVQRLRMETNTGAIDGRNAGMKRMHGRYLVFLDNDAVVRTRSWLEKLMAIIGADVTIGAIGPKLVYALPPHDIQCAGCDVTQGGRVAFRGRGSPRMTPEFNVQRDCQTLISACWMMSRVAAELIGPLDPRFSPVQFEDIDYCYRLRESGFRCVYAPSVEMYHFENVTTGRTAELNYPYLTVKNGLKFKEKWQKHYQAEKGPADADWTWAKVATVTLDNVPENLELI